MIARAATPPANDNVENATPIALGSTLSATTRDASFEAGAIGYTFTVWFRLTVTATTTVALNSCDRVALTVYSDDVLRAGPQCQVQFEAQAGTAYTILAESAQETDFTISAEAVPPPP